MTPTRRQVIGGIGGIGATALAGGIGLTALSGSVAGSNLSISDPNAVTTDDGNIQRVTVALDHEATWDGFDRPVDAVAYWDRITLRPNNEAVEHVVYDNRDAPVLLENYSSKGDGSDGWGGPGEYVEGLGDPSSQHYKESGTVYADINWNIVVDPNYASAKSVETPFEIDGESVLEPTKDGNTKDNVIEYEKRVYFYEEGAGEKTSDDGSVTDLGRLSGDGVTEYTSSVGEFTLSVTNEASTDDGSGTGSSSAQ